MDGRAVAREVHMSRFGLGTLARIAACAAACGALGVLLVGDAGAVDDFRTKIEKWVQTRQLISEERADWEADRRTLRATRDLLREEKAALEAEIEELSAEDEASDVERRDLVLQRGELQRASGALEAEIRTMEEAVVALVPRLPEPLQRKLEPLLVQIPKDPETTRVPLGQRLVNVLGVLAQAEKWNGTATFVGETRAVDGDERVQIRTLYWGLGEAIYVDAKGRTAGIGRPGPEGWTFSKDDHLADDAELLLDIYEGNVDEIEFVRLPVEIR